MKNPQLLAFALCLTNLLSLTLCTPSVWFVKPPGKPKKFLLIEGVMLQSSYRLLTADSLCECVWRISCCLVLVIGLVGIYIFFSCMFCFCLIVILVLEVLIYIFSINIFITIVNVILYPSSLNNNDNDNDKDTKHHFQHHK